MVVPQHVLKTPFLLEWRNLPDHENAANQPIIGRSMIHGMEKSYHQRQKSNEAKSLWWKCGKQLKKREFVLPACKMAIGHLNWMGDWNNCHDINPDGSLLLGKLKLVMRKIWIHGIKVELDGRSLKDHLRFVSCLVFCFLTVVV